jgi:hypothetical protein
MLCDRCVKMPWRGGGFVVTRLHLRYGKEGLGEDLVFRQAPPIVGGREFVTDGKCPRNRRRAKRNEQFPGALCNSTCMGRAL